MNDIPNQYATVLQNGIQFVKKFTNLEALNLSNNKIKI
jgi:hypothetical protein